MYASAAYVCAQVVEGSELIFEYSRRFFENSLSASVCVCVSVCVCRNRCSWCSIPMYSSEWMYWTLFNTIYFHWLRLWTNKPQQQQKSRKKNAELNKLKHFAHIDCTVYSAIAILIIFLLYASARCSILWSSSPYLLNLKISLRKNKNVYDSNFYLLTISSDKLVVLFCWQSRAHTAAASLYADFISFLPFCFHISCGTCHRNIVAMADARWMDVDNKYSDDDYRTILVNGWHDLAGRCAMGCFQ